MKVYKECCKNCLLSPDSIVSPKRRVEILQTCAKTQTHFICHKASMNEDDICCKNFYDRLGHISQNIRIAQALNVVQFIDQPESEKLITHKQMETKR